MCTISFVYVGKNNDNLFIAHQSFANSNSYHAAYALTSSLTSSLTILNSGRNNNNGASNVRKSSVNLNKISMSFELCAFYDEIKCEGEDTFGTDRPSGKSAMITSNPPNLQISDDT